MRTQNIEWHVFNIKWWRYKISEPLNPGEWVTGRPEALTAPVQYVLNRYRSYQWVLLSHNIPPFLKDGSPYSTTVYIHENCVSEQLLYGAGQDVEAETCGVLSTKNHREKDPAALRVRAKKLSRKILVKILCTFYLCSPGIKVFILLTLRYLWSLSTWSRDLYGSQLSQDSSNPLQRTLNSKVPRLVLSLRWPWMDSTTNSCSLCCATSSGDVLTGS